MLRSYDTTDDALICEQIELPLNITQEPAGFAMKHTCAISVRPPEGALSTYGGHITMFFNKAEPTSDEGE